MYSLMRRFRFLAPLLIVLLVFLVPAQTAHAGFVADAVGSVFDAAASVVSSVVDVAVSVVSDVVSAASEVLSSPLGTILLAVALNVIVPGAGTFIADGIGEFAFNAALDIGVGTADALAFSAAAVDVYTGIGFFRTMDAVACLGIGVSATFSGCGGNDASQIPTGAYATPIGCASADCTCYGPSNSCGQSYSGTVVPASIDEYGYSTPSSCRSGTTDLTTYGAPPESGCPQHGCGVGTLNDLCPPPPPSGCGVGTLNDQCPLPSGCGEGTLNNQCPPPSGCGKGTLNDLCPPLVSGCGEGTLNDTCPEPTLPSGCGRNTLNDRCPPPHGCGDGTLNDQCPVTPSGCGEGTRNDTCPVIPSGCGPGTLNDTCKTSPKLISGCGEGTLNDTCPICPNKGKACTQTNSCGMSNTGLVLCDGTTDVCPVSAPPESGTGGCATPDISMTASPALVNPGNSCTIDWNISNVTRCTLSSDIADPALPKSVSVPTGSYTSPNLTTPVTYTLICHNGDVAVTQKSTSCRLNPTFKEI